MTSAAGREVATLRELVGHRAYWVWSLATQLTRLPALMAPIAFVLVSQKTTGSPATGGLLVTVSTLAGVAAAPLTGRLMDRLGTARWTPLAMYVVALTRLALAFAFMLAAPTAALLAVVALGSVIGAGTGGATRTLLSRVVPARLLSPALALDSTMIEFVVIVAPLVVAAAAVPAPEGALIAMAVGTGLAGLLLAFMIRSYGAGDRGRRRPADVEATAGPRSLWLNARFAFWVVVALAFGQSLGTAEVGALPVASSLGGGAATGALLVAILGGTSAASGVAYAWLTHRIRLNATFQACILLALMVVSGLGIALAGGWVPLGLAFAALGAWTAPINTVRSHAAEDEMPAHRTTEGFSIVNSANAVGYALAGLLLAALPLRGMLLAGPAAALLALALAPVLMSRPRQWAVATADSGGVSTNR